MIDYPVSHPLANHDSCAVSVGPDSIRHDKRAGNPQPLNPAYPAVLVYHGHLAGVRTHLAGAGQLLPDPHVFHKLLFQSIVRSQVCFYQRNKLLYDDIEGLMLHHVQDDPYSLPQPFSVFGVLQVSTINEHLLVGAIGVKPQFPGALGKFRHTDEPDSFFVEEVSP